MSAALFAEFSPSTYDEWLAALRDSRPGADPESLCTRTAEGITIHPLPHPEAPHFPSELGDASFLRASFGNWQIAQEINLAEPRAFNRALQAALANGQTAIALHAGPRLQKPADLDTALAGIDLALYPLFAADAVVFDWLRATRSAQTMANLRGCIGSPSADFAALADRFSVAEAVSPALGCVDINTAEQHANGANAAQELAFALATGAEILRSLVRRGLPADTVASRLQVTLSIGEDFFMQVAKFRAAKSLWAQMTRAFGASKTAQTIHLRARSGTRNKSLETAHNNLLRLTCEAVAAALAGVDSMTLAAFDAPADDEFSRRLSRNIQLILQHEVQLTRSSDPAGGSWHVEWLTDQLGRRAWVAFQRIEAERQHAHTLPGAG